MSPGVTFERVYRELRRMLVEGELPPGAPLEPAQIGSTIASSITPVRDALHRLTGEQLVEAPNHNGFRVPLPTEAGLRDLYHWNGRLLVLAARSRRLERTSITSEPVDAADTAAATARFFRELAESTGSEEHCDAVARTSDRLAPYRRAEARILPDVKEELALLQDAAGHPAELARRLTLYHRRRAKAVPEILVACRRRPLAG